MQGSSSDCKHFEKCSAPLCPKLSEQSLHLLYWFPGEEICRLKMGAPKWVKRQRKVTKAVKPENNGFYFPYTTLSNRMRVTEHIKGINPDKPKKEHRQNEQP